MKILLNRRLAKHVTNISFRIFLRNRNLNRGKVHTQNNLRLKHRRSKALFIIQKTKIDVNLFGKFHLAQFG